MTREEQVYSTNTGEFTAEKLLPCPFCGGEPEFITIGNDHTKSRKAEIKCTKCFCKRTTGAIRNDLEWCGRKAIELWNKRTDESSLLPAEGAELDRQHDHPEGAEEILDRLEGHPGYSLNDSRVRLSRPQVIMAMTEFATIHAQRIAEKMVEERLREELIKYEIYWNFVLKETAEKIVDEYLKTREK